MIRSVLIGGVMALLSLSVVAADESAQAAKKLPTEVKIISVPAPQPAEVRIVSMPAAPPHQVTVNVPKDESTHDLVVGTWGLFGATVVLAFGTFFVAWWQSRDTKRRDRDAMMREVSRAAHRVLTEATRVEQMASLVPTARVQVHALANHSVIPQILAEMEKALADRREGLMQMVDKASFVLTDQSDTLAPLVALSDKELTKHLWKLDEQQIRLQAMRDAITQELQRYEAESTTLRQQNTAMQAALAAKPGPPLKTTLG